jgi:hypothetical protein
MPSASALRSVASDVALQSPTVTIHDGASSTSPALLSKWQGKQRPSHD